MLLALLPLLLHAQSSDPITRDSYGIPLIKAINEVEGCRLAGYAVAQDRLWQMEMSRRLARGKMAEVLGKQYVASDKEVILNGYSDAELAQQVHNLSKQVQDDFDAYADGVNRYIGEAKAKGDLPKGYASAGFSPDPWTPVDSAAIAVRLFQLFGRMTGGELRNLAALQYLKGQKALAGKELDVFDDLVWQNDPDAPTTISSDDAAQAPPVNVLPALNRAVTEKQLAGMPATNLFELLPGLELASRKASTAVAMREGVPFKTGSYAIVVAPKRSASGAPMLLSGPQMGFTKPAIIHEIGITTPRLTVQGIDIPGVPGVAIGATQDLAWGLTTGVADMEDIYYTKAVGSDSYEDGPGNVKPLFKEDVTLNVKGGDPITVTRLRTRVGPVILKTASGYYFTRHASSWMSELQGLEALRNLTLTCTAAESDQALKPATVNFNVFYALRAGDIGYRYTGAIPIRAPGWDPRLPMPLEPDTEWKGMVPYASMPHVQNPKSGLLSNWNNKPVSWWPNGDTPAWGAIQHVSTLRSFLTGPKLTTSTLETAAWSIARTDENFPLFKPYVQSAKSPYLANFDGLNYTGSFGAATFQDWLDGVRDELFKKLTGTFVDPTLYRTAVQPSVILRALQGKTKVDYLQGRKAIDVVHAAESRLHDGRRYTAGAIRLPGIDPIPYSNRGSYIQIIEFYGGQVTGRNVLPPGEAESGPHSEDQVGLSRAWVYKPMQLLVP